MSIPRKPIRRPTTIHHNKVDAFWTIEYGKRENWDYSSDKGLNMKYAYVCWDEMCEASDNIMRKETRRWVLGMPCMSWVKELKDHIGADHYIHSVKHSHDGELYIFYRELQYKTEQEDKMKEAEKKILLEYIEDGEDLI